MNERKWVPTLDCHCDNCEAARKEALTAKDQREKPFNHIGRDVSAYRVRQESGSLRVDRTESGSASFVFMHGSPCTVYEVPSFDIPSVIERLQEIVAENEK